MKNRQQKGPCPDCDDTGILKLTTELNFSSTPCHCGATGEKRVAKKRAAPVSSQPPRYFRGAKLRNT